jgi:hypothetical protein
VAGTKHIGPFFFLSNSVFWRRFQGVGKKDPKVIVFDDLVILLVRRSKPHDSQNITRSGCNKNQENLNHKQMDVLPRSLVSC